MEARTKTEGSPRTAVEEASADAVQSLLEAVTPAAPKLVPQQSALGVLVGWDESGRPLIAYPDQPASEPVSALTTVALAVADLGREVALLFVGDERRPLIVGVVQPPGPVEALPVPGRVVSSVDGESLEFTAGREIIFRCGDASITLTKAGKVLIQGAYLLSRSTGVNRIKGGSVQIN